MSVSYPTMIRYKDAIIRGRNNHWQVELNFNGQRLRHTEPTLKLAKAYVDSYTKQIRQEGEGALLLSHKQRHDAREALEILDGALDPKELKKKRSTPLSEAARFWIIHHPQGVTVPSLLELLNGYLKAKSNRRKETKYEIKNKVGRFVNDFQGRSITELTSRSVDGWLCAKFETLGNRRKYYRLLHAFFDFAVKKQYIETNPIKQVFIDTGDLNEILPEAYNVDEVKQILESALELAPEIIPSLAIGFFAGLRPNELLILNWEDINFDERIIRVSPEAAKKRRQRFVDMSENLIAWLLPHCKTTGPISVASTKFLRKRAEVLKSASVNKWIRDGLRHTFATYHLAAKQDPSATAFQLGHGRNPDLLYQHYRQLAKQSEAIRFWKIFPSS